MTAPFAHDTRAEPEPLGPWTAEALASLRAIDPAFAEACHAVSTNPWANGVLKPHFVELTAAAVALACTSLDRENARRHMRAALEAGASRDQLATLVKMATLLALHSCSLGAPILIEEAGADRLAVARSDAPTPAVDRMKAMGQWNAAWDPFLALDARWTDQFMAAGAALYGATIFSAKETELLSIAFDASFTHMYAPGTRRHIRGALAAGASVAEIMDVLKICAAYGVAAMNAGLPLLAEVIETFEAETRR